MRKILFVCLGNICRSPMGEGIFQKMIEEQQLTDQLSCDSCGTSAYHVGEKADGRMREHAIERGYELLSISRQFDPSNDFEKFDLILAMDEHNYETLKSMDRNGRYKDKIKTMVSYCKIHKVDKVPDPYYGGGDGFNLVIDILEDACTELMKSLKT